MTQKFTTLFFLFVGCIGCLFGAQPVITSISPSNGDIAVGTIITITGSGFTGLTPVTAVDFGDRAAAGFTLNSSTSITATAPAGTAGSVHVTVTNTISQTSSATPADLYTYTQQNGWRGILSSTMPNQQVTLFQTANNMVSATIPQSTPSLVAVMSPDGTVIYTANESPPTVTVYDAANNMLLQTVTLPVADVPFDMCVSPDGTKIYVSNSNPSPPQTVSVIDTTTPIFTTIDIPITAAFLLGPISITPDGKTVYVTDFFPGAVIPIDVSTPIPTPGTPIVTGSSPGLTSITPDGKTGFVGNQFSNTVTVIDLSTNTIVNQIMLPTGAGPYGSSILPNGKTLYVANILNSTVSVIDVATETITQTVLLPGNEPFWAAATPDGKTVYIANQMADNVTPIDVATNIAGSSFAMNAQLKNISMSPDPSPVASFSTVIRPVTFPTIFDASASISPIGTIVKYDWNFGDGATLSTTVPLAAHIYNSAGSYNVTLTVTNSAGTSTAKVYSTQFMSNDGGPLAFSLMPIVIPSCGSCTQEPRILFVNNSNASPGDGSYNNPYNDLAFALSQPQSFPCDVIYVFPGNGPYNGEFVLQDFQRLLGTSTEAFQLCPTTASCNIPLLTNVAGPLVVTLGNNNEVSGFHIQCFFNGMGATAGISGGPIPITPLPLPPSITNALITHNVIEVKNGGNGIVFYADPQLGQINISNCTLFGSDNTGTRGIQITNCGNGNFEIANNNFSGIDASTDVGIGIYINDSTGDLKANIHNNSFRSSGASTDTSGSIVFFNMGSIGRQNVVIKENYIERLPGIKTAGGIGCLNLNSSGPFCLFLDKNIVISPDGVPGYLLWNASASSYELNFDNSNEGSVLINAPRPIIPIPLPTFTPITLSIGCQ